MVNATWLLISKWILIALAYRQFGRSDLNSNLHNKMRNHYDSVAEIDKEILNKIAQYLSELFVQKLNNQMKGNESIISINSTLNNSII